MFIDAGELWDFYNRPLGHTVRRVLGTRVRARWRHIEGQTLIGLGYAAPFLGSFRGEARRLGALMPAEQGAVVWPTNGDSLTVIASEDALPLSDGSVDRLLVVHCLEFTERVRPLLREIWRVLAPEGRVMFIVPNRRGVWARVDKTPFGQGRPFSRGQLERLLEQAMLTPVECWWALHWPPFERQVVLRSAVTLERLGARVWPGFGGVMLLEASKELAAPIGKGVRVRSISDLVTVPGTVPVGQAGRGRLLERAPTVRVDQRPSVAPRTVQPKS